MLLLSVVLEDPAEIEYQAELFLEIYGNLMIRSKTNEYVSSKATELIRTVTDQTGILSKIIDFKLCKYRELDDIEFVFQFWRSDRGFDGSALWDSRLRQYLKSRYDARENVFDWEYNMKLMDRTPHALISKREYLHWRHTGIAFSVRESTYEKTNRTMATVDALKQVIYFLIRMESELTNGVCLVISLPVHILHLVSKQNSLI
jgi:dynein assembly factor 3, axonemal